MKILNHKTALITGLLSLSTLAMAHPGHQEGVHSFGDAVMMGLVHPFTGADHMMLAMGMGMIMYRYRHSAWGLMSLLAGLALGFMFAVSGQLNDVSIAGIGLENIAEYGIYLSIAVVAIGLFSRKLLAMNSRVARGIAMLGLMMLAMFHGAAHGFEVPETMQASGFFMGMVIGMSLLFAIGTGVMIVIRRFAKDNPIYERILAVLGVAAVALS